jgi:hypothetical protein
MKSFVKTALKNQCGKPGKRSKKKPPSNWGQTLCLVGALLKGGASSLIISAIAEKSPSSRA